MAKTIAIPIAILAVFNLFFSGWIEFGGDLISSVYNTPAEYFQGFKEAISLYPTIPQSGHLWYCYTYILVIITFPVLDAFVQWMNQDCQREKAFCAITFILLVINDCTQNQMLNFSHHGLNAAVPAAIEILWGHIIYRHKEKLLLTKGKIVYLLFLFFSFVALNYMRMYIVLYTGSKAILYWYSSIGLLCGMCIITFCIIVSTYIKIESISTVINNIASYTFLIYLIHYSVRTVLFRYNIDIECLEWMSQFFDAIQLELIYTILIIIIVFIISFIISVVIKKMCHILLKYGAYVKNILKY